MKMPLVKASREQWSKWVELHYPFDAKWERHLSIRQPHQRGPLGNAEELNDLRGMRDRAQAVMFAILWAGANRIAADSLQRYDRDPVHRDEPTQRRSSAMVHGDLNPDSMMPHYEQQNLGL